MGRYHGRKVVTGSVKTGRIHRRMQQRRLSKYGRPTTTPAPDTVVPAPKMIVLSYALLTKPSTPIVAAESL